MVALSIALGTWLGGDSAFFIRLMASIYSLLTSLLLIDAIRRITAACMPERDIQDHRSLWFVLLLSQAMPLFFVNASMANTDGPLTFFCFLAVYALRL